MLHIGYISELSQNIGVIIDALHKAHCFSVNKESFTIGQFVTFEGEEALVDDVIDLRDYPIVRGPYVNRTDPFYIQFGVGPIYKYFITSKNGDVYWLRGAESFIVEKIINDEDPLSKTFELSFSDYFNEVQSIYLNVEYVSYNLKKIAESYTIKYEKIHIPKIGGDDRFYVDRDVKIDYCDSYLARFFKKSETIFSDSGYTSHFEIPDKIKKEMEDNGDLARQKFLSEYDKVEHLSFLLFELQNKYIQENNKIAEERNKLLAYWPIGQERGEFVEESKVWSYRWKILNLVSDRNDINKVIKEIEKFNNRNTMIFRRNMFEKP